MRRYRGLKVVSCKKAVGRWASREYGKLPNFDLSKFKSDSIKECAKIGLKKFRKKHMAFDQTYEIRDSGEYDLK